MIIPGGVVAVFVFGAVPNSFGAAEPNTFGEVAAVPRIFGEGNGDVLIFVHEGSGNSSSSFTPTGVCKSGEGCGDGEGL